MEFSRQEYWSGWPFPSPGDLPDPGMEPRSPSLQGDSLSSEPLGKQNRVWMLFKKKKSDNVSHSVVSNSSWPMDCSPPGSSVHGKNYGGKNTRMGCHVLLQGIFPTQGWNLCLLSFLHKQEESSPPPPPENVINSSSTSAFFPEWLWHKFTQMN